LVIESTAVVAGDALLDVPADNFQPGEEFLLRPLVARFQR